MRIELNPVDRVIYHLDQVTEPWSVHCEVRVEGRLDPARVAAAAASAAARHPLARARLAAVRPYARTLFWDIADRADRVPLTVVDCAEDPALDRARSELLSRRLDVSRAPSFALTVARHAGGDRLILNLNHVAGDGISSYRLMASIMRAYAGVEDPTPGPDPLRVRRLREHLGAGNRDAADRIEQPARIAIRGGERDVLGFGFELIALAPDETAELLSRRREPASVNDLLLASLAVAIGRFNDAAGVDLADIALATPVNLRPRAFPLEVVSNIFATASVPIRAADAAELVTAQAAVVERTQVLKRRREQGGSIRQGSGRWPTGILHLATRLLRGAAASRADTAVLSNLGRLPAPLELGADAGRVAELWFSPPGRMPLGIAIGAVTIEDAMFLTIRYCRAQFDAAGAAAFARTWREVLIG